MAQALGFRSGLAKGLKSGLRLRRDDAQHFQLLAVMCITPNSLFVQVRQTAKTVTLNEHVNAGSGPASIHIVLI
jgi:hypothetical protein